MLENLTSEQRDTVLRFLLHRMPMDTRHELMRSLPMAYVKLYPTAGAEVVSMVRSHVEALTAN